MKGCAYLLMMEKVLYFDLFLFYFIFIFISFYLFIFLKNKGVGSFRYTETKKRKFDDYTVNNNSRPSVNKKKHK